MRIANRHRTPNTAQVVAGEATASGPGLAPRRALTVTAALTLGSLLVLIDLLLVGHTTGEKIWGPVVAASGTLVGLLSLVYLATAGRNRMARVVLILLWAMVAFFGYGGYNDHRLAGRADTASGHRTPPPLAPLVFTGFGLAGGAALYTGSKATKGSAVGGPNAATASRADSIV